MTTTPRYVLLTTGPKSHYCKDTRTGDLCVMFHTKRQAVEVVAEKNARPARPARTK